MKDSIDILNLLKVIRKRLFFLVSSFIIPAVVAMVISFLLPPAYTSSLTIFAPEVAAGGSISTGLLTAFTTFRPKGAEISTQAVIGMLKSQRMIYRVIQNFDLIKLYKFRDIESAADYVRKKMISVEFNEGEGVITISVTTRWRTLSKDIAYFYVQNLNEINEELKLTSMKDIAKILDFPTIPLKKSKPKVKLNMAIAGLVGLFFGSVFIYVQEKKLGAKRA